MNGPNESHQVTMMSSIRAHHVNCNSNTRRIRNQLLRFSWTSVTAITLLLSLSSSHNNNSNVIRIITPSEARSTFIGSAIDGGSPPVNVPSMSEKSAFSTPIFDPTIDAYEYQTQHCPALAIPPPAASSPTRSSIYGGPDSAQSSAYGGHGGLPSACPATKDGMLNVHIICHTHLDTGWVETFDQYYYGYVETIINSVVKSLLESARRRFIMVETSFFMRWWREQNDYIKNRFKKLVNNGQIEFISGGWSMNDEAVSHYSAIIDQMSLGHKHLFKLFGHCGGVPKIGWQIDPFGHSREYASLLAQMAFDGLFLGRIDFQDKTFRQHTQSMEFVWKASPSLGSFKSDLFTSVLPNNYSPPDQFCFDINCSDEELNKYNIHQKALQFSRLMLEQADTYSTNHTVVTMGMDFHYRDANKWYTNLDILFDEINSNPARYKINLIYSTPSCYLRQLHRTKHVSWPVKLDDFFPYADSHNSYWTGYYTSRPGLKYQIVMANNFLQAAKQLSVLANPRTNQDAVDELDSLQETLGILQHHDAVTGTCKQFVNDDYSRMLSQAMKRAHHSLVTSVAKIVDFNTNPAMACHTGGNNHTTAQHSQAPTPIDLYIMKGEHIFCSSLNASHCQVSEKLDRFGKLLVHLYNPGSHSVQHYVQVPVRDAHYIVRDVGGTMVPLSQLTPIPPSVLKLTSIESRTDYGVIDPEVSKELLFVTVLPPLTMATFVLEKVAPNLSSLPVRGAPSAVSLVGVASGRSAAVTPQLTNNNIIRRDASQQQQQALVGSDPVFGNSRISGVIDRHSGLLKGVILNDGRLMPFSQNFFFYDADGKYKPEKNSGAYIFNPTDRGATRVSTKVEYEILRGPVVEEVHQVFSPWCSQVIRIYKHSDYIEFHWLVGPIPVQEGNSGYAGYPNGFDNGREVISLYDTNMKTNGTFFTDSNGRETVRRVRNHRSDFRLYTTEHTASNYYPITSWIFIRDYEQNLQLSLLPDRPQGGSSVRDGQLELMVHRRLLQDDGLGVEEPLNEPGIDRRGLVIRGKHYMLLGPIDNVIRATRMLSKQLYLQPIKWFQAMPNIPPISSNGVSTSSSPPLTRYKFSGLNQALPRSLNLVTLESWDPRHVLIRLEHIFEINEDADYSRPVQVSLKRLFKNFRIERIKEMTLDGLQDMQMALERRLSFPTATNPYRNYTDELRDYVNTEYVEQALREAVLNENLFIITMRPMEIRTFLVQINYDLCHSASQQSPSSLLMADDPSSSFRMSS